MTGTVASMCRSIKMLREPEMAGPEEVHEAALQYVRKVSGYRRPSKVNTEAFDRAVDEVAQTTSRLLADLVVKPSTKGGSSSLPR